MTRRGFEALKEELDRFKRVERPKNIQQIAEAAHEAGRVVATLGLSMKKNVRLARDLGLIRLPDSAFVDIEK